MLSNYQLILLSKVKFIVFFGFMEIIKIQVKENRLALNLLLFFLHVNPSDPTFFVRALLMPLGGGFFFDFFAS